MGGFVYIVRNLNIAIKLTKNFAVISEAIFAGRTGLEPATSAVTGRCSNQLNYRPR